MVLKVRSIIPLESIHDGLARHLQVSMLESFGDIEIAKNQANCWNILANFLGIYNILK